MALGLLTGSVTLRGRHGWVEEGYWVAPEELRETMFESEPGREAEYQQNGMRGVLESFWLPGLGSVKPDFRVAVNQGPALVSWLQFPWICTQFPV